MIIQKQDPFDLLNHQNKTQVFAVIKVSSIIKSRGEHV